MTEKFDFEQALKAIQSGQSISGQEGVLAPLVKQLTEAALEAELDSQLMNSISAQATITIWCINARHKTISGLPRLVIPLRSNPRQPILGDGSTTFKTRERIFLTSCRSRRW